MINEVKKDGFLCGIDEAGRGPLAGPLVMAGVILKQKIDGLTDSKVLTPGRRMALYNLIKEHSQHHIVIIDNETIDKDGLSACLRLGLQEIVGIMSGEGVDFIFDGNSAYGMSGVSTMVKADAKISEVSAASIMAKVTRDRIMEKYAAVFSGYGFEKHKGYGTRAHLEAIERLGLSPIHRKSFRIKNRETNKV